MKHFLLLSAIGASLFLGGCAAAPAGQMDHDGMSMTMHDMMMMLEGKTGDEFDKAFIQGMIPHHQGAIDMAREALKNAKHEEIKQLARDIIASQQREIDAMKQWQEQWGY